jgi:hypothetical protein
MLSHPISRQDRNREKEKSDLENLPNPRTENGDDDVL